MQSLLAGHTVSDAMTANYIEIAPDLTLQELVDRHILGGGRRVFAVKATARWTACLRSTASRRCLGHNGPRPPSPK